MPITRIRYEEETWPIEDFVQACLNGECEFPATVAATIIANMAKYSNHDTISGSQLHAECDLKRLLESAYDYTVDIEDQFYASYRGANVHALIEQCRHDSRFSEWLFEERFFAVLTPDDRLMVLLVPEQSSGEPDWELFEVICSEWRAKGSIILSGALDAYDGLSGTIHDYKTAKSVGSWTNVKESWQQQMNMYTILARLNGYRVNTVRITVMDATEPIVLTVPTVNAESWIPAYFIPRVRELWRQQRIPKDVVRDVNDGKQPAPEGFPLPVVNYLCSGGKRGDSKVYCSMRTNEICPIWRNREQRTLEQTQVAT